MAGTYEAGVYNRTMDMQPYFQLMNSSPPPLYVVPGMQVGCSVYDGLSASTLECFFSSSCLKSTATWISNLTPEQWPEPLIHSVTSRFSPNFTIHTLLNEQLLESWNNTVDYAAYYNACRPSQCTYTLESRNGLLYIITSLLALYGGLTAILRIIAPLMTNWIEGIWTRGRLFFERTENVIPIEQAAQGIVEIFHSLFIYAI